MSMALGHENPDVYRMAIMPSRLGKRGFCVEGEAAGCAGGGNFDSDFDLDLGRFPGERGH